MVHLPYGGIGRWLPSSSPVPWWIPVTLTLSSFISLSSSGDRLLALFSSSVVQSLYNQCLTLCHGPSHHGSLQTIAFKLAHAATINLRAFLLSESLNDDQRISFNNTNTGWAVTCNLLIQYLCPPHGLVNGGTCCKIQLVSFTFHVLPWLQNNWIPTVFDKLSHYNCSLSLNTVRQWPCPPGQFLKPRSIQKE